MVAQLNSLWNSRLGSDVVLQQNSMFHQSSEVNQEVQSGGTDRKSVV